MVMLGAAARTQETDDAVFGVDRHMVFEFESALRATIVPGPNLAIGWHLDITH